MAANRRKAEEAAHQLVRSLARPTLPIDVERLATQEGLKVIHERFATDVSGTIVRESTGRVVLGVNTYHSKTRQRFTVAHELGHWKLHLENKRVGTFVDRPAEVLFRDRVASEGVDAKEIEANAFAAALLMPEDLVIREARRAFRTQPSLPSEQLVDRLAADFNVSQQAARYRLMNLHILDPL